MRFFIVLLMFGTSFFMGSPVAADSSAMLHALLGVNSPGLTVSFEENGGTTVSDQIVSHGGLAISPTTIKTNYAFDGWYSDSGLSTVYNFSTPVTSSITLYAKWTGNSYKVVILNNVGNSDSGGWCTGWFTFNSPYFPQYTENGNYECTTKSTDGDGHFHHVVINPYNLTFYIDRSTACGLGTSMSCFINPSIVGTYTCNAPDYSGYQVIISHNPEYTINTYAVVFEENSGSIVTDQTVSHGDLATSPSPTTTRAGYTFEGWYSDSGLTTVYNFSTPVTSSITLYAKMVEISTIVSFDLVAAIPTTCHANQCGSRGRLTMNDNELSLSAYGNTYTYKYTDGILYFGINGTWSYLTSLSLVGQPCNFHYISDRGDGWTITNCGY